MNELKESIIHGRKVGVLLDEYLGREGMNPCQTKLILGTRQNETLNLMNLRRTNFLRGISSFPKSFRVLSNTTLRYIS